MAETEIAGIKLTLRDDMPSEECWDMIGIIDQLSGGIEKVSYPEAERFLRVFVTAWDRPVPVTDPDAFRKLHLLNEFLPMVRKVAHHIATGMPSSKNSPDAPTSP